MRKQSAQRQKEILEILKQSARPMTAYEILGELKGSEAGVAPPTVYRALTALTGEGRAHRLESINAFISCQCGHAEHTPVLAICEDCGSVEEHDEPEVTDRLTAITRETGFMARRHVVEIHGLCGTCAA